MSRNGTRTLEQERRWRQTAKDRADAEVQAIRDRHADYTPPNVRTYGEPWDSRIAAAAISAMPYPESPNKGTKR